MRKKTVEKIAHRSDFITVTEGSGLRGRDVLRAVGKTHLLLMQQRNLPLAQTKQRLYDCSEHRILSAKRMGGGGRKTRRSAVTSAGGGREACPAGRDSPRPPGLLIPLCAAISVSAQRIPSRLPAPFAARKNSQGIPGCFLFVGISLIPPEGGGRQSAGRLSPASSVPPLHTAHLRTGTSSGTGTPRAGSRGSECRR